ncbi:TIGR01621 family pseudouridine synthase [Aestuariibacter salexigens]|uniref:TIGR01621 family pseudouridine synthase n=1 Tax=Aestuariibacter salexigens TaxID=226010 RepID=UPI000401E81D|nr:TIGR01621 family pseudouridine synthase [Aestuariibacter salexigens]
MKNSPERIPYSFEHQDFIVIDKPAGVSVHDSETQPGVVSLLRTQNGDMPLYLCHRLDKDTSGLLILAKNAETAAYFGQLFHQHQINKYYLALCAKKGKKKQGAIKGDMKKSRDGSWILTPSTTPSAITQFFSAGADATDTTAYRKMLLRPLSGKTHQLRVAMKSNSSPIVGDRRYKGIAADRMYLHAYALNFYYHDMRVEIVLMPNTGDHFRSLNIPSEWHSPWELKWPKLNTGAPAC